MQTRFSPAQLNTPDGKLAESILRACVHCGFCTATCPTFLQTGNELDSPRGRIYLIKEMLEKETASGITAQHLNRCLTCRSCETTCPSSVQYHTLLDIGRKHIKNHHRPSRWHTFRQSLLLMLLGNRRLFSVAVKAGRLFRVILPGSLSAQLPGKTRFEKWPKNRQARPGTPQRKVVLLEGCVQSELSPDTNSAVRLVLDRLQIQTLTVSQESCCGAMQFHTDAQAAGIKRAKKLVEQLELSLQQGAEAIISTASGCGSFIKDYPTLFRNDEHYLERARTLMNHVRDISEFLLAENLGLLKLAPGQTLAFHSPCSLQHGQKLSGKTEALLTQLGFTIPAVTDAHLCCGSAGTYSLFHPEMAGNLRREKLKHLDQVSGEGIATANIGCQCHLAAKSSRPVRHWIEYVADAIGNTG